MKVLLTFSFFAALFASVGCSSGPAPAPQYNQVHVSDPHGLLQDQPGDDAAKAAASESHQKDRELAFEKKGEFQASLDARITAWTEKVGELKALAKRSRLATRKKLTTKITGIENQILEAKNHLNEMRASDVNEFEQQRSQLDTDSEKVRSAFEKVGAAE